MSKEVIYSLLHSEVLRLLEGWGRRDLGPWRWRGGARATPSTTS